MVAPGFCVNSFFIVLFSLLNREYDLIFLLLPRIIVAPISFIKSEFLNFVKNILCQTESFGRMDCIVKLCQGIYRKSLSIQLFLHFDEVSFVAYFPIYSAEIIIYKVIDQVSISPISAIEVKFVSKNSIRVGKSP